MDRIKELEQQVEHLRERVGHWKRLAKEQRPRYTTLKESSRPITTSQHWHYKHIVLEQWPKDMSLNETMKYIQAEVLPEHYPYRYDNCYRTARLGWVVVLCGEVKEVIEMSYDPSE